MRTWYCHRAGLSYGPFDDTRLVQLVRTGRLAATDWLSASQGQLWQPAASVAGLFHAPRPTLPLPAAVNPAGVVARPVYTPVSAYVQPVGVPPTPVAAPAGTPTRRGLGWIRARASRPLAPDRRSRSGALLAVALLLLALAALYGWTLQG